MNKLEKSNKKYKDKIFEDIKHIDEYGNEYWYARELQQVLEYSQWRRFDNVINRAKEACKSSNYVVSDHFANVGKKVKTGDSIRNIKDYKLSRYACYLIVQNGDSRKRLIALGQTYFAIQTRRQELTEQEYESLNENEKRFYQRKLTKRGNYTLQQVAKNAGVKNIDQFHNAGYKGLYNGETANDIFKRKNLRYREDILDNMGEDELVTNLFRINQTKQKLQNENIQGELNAKRAHNLVGKEVRKTIKRLGGTCQKIYQHQIKV
jgi:DNA-damage-inducible protein D